MDKVLLIDGNQGIYIPQIFAKQYEAAICFEAIQAKNAEYGRINMQEVIDILKYGPNHDEYWEVWGECLSNAIIKIGDTQYTIDQDGDLWAIPDGYEEQEETEDSYQWHWKADNAKTYGLYFEETRIALLDVELTSGIIEDIVEALNSAGVEFKP